MFRADGVTRTSRLAATRMSSCRTTSIWMAPLGGSAEEHRYHQRHRPVLWNKMARIGLRMQVMLDETLFRDKLEPLSPA